MRIIDKNKDYYDFYQNIYKDDTFTFDRRDSYDLSKKEFANSFYLRHYGDYYKDVKIVILQICHTFWLFQLKVKTSSHHGYGDQIEDYDLILLSTWKDYTSKRELIKLSSVDYAIRLRNGSYDINIEGIMNDIKHNEFNSSYYVFDYFPVYIGDDIKNKTVKHIPILKNIGIASLVSPLDIYLALEEYFSEEKSSSEKTEPVDWTNDDKIIEHGFDTKTSFRGKLNT